MPFCFQLLCTQYPGILVLKIMNNSTLIDKPRKETRGELGYDLESAVSMAKFQIQAVTVNELTGGS